jgi:hypothetical protein
MTAAVIPKTTHHHLLHCPSQACQDLFLSLSTEFYTLCKTVRLDPLLHKAFLTLISPYWGESVAFDLPPAYVYLVIFQQELHDNSVFMACLSTQWTTLQHEYLALNHFPHDKQQAATTIKTVLTYLLDGVHTVWLTRNSALHGDAATTQLRSYKHTQLLLEIQDLYDQQAQMLAADRRLFVHPYEYWLAQSMTQLKTFLKRMRPTVRTSIKQANDLGTNFRAIDSYFSPLIPPDIFAAILDKPYIPPAEPD